MDAHRFILPSRVIGLLCLLPAIVAGGLGAWFYTSSRHFFARAISVPGVVTHLKASPGSDGAMYNEFEFKDTAGVMQHAVTGWASNPPAYAVGERVDVLYVPGDPASARIRSFTSLWLGAAICGALTVVHLVVSMVFIWLIPFVIRRVWPREKATVVGG